MRPVSGSIFAAFSPVRCGSRFFFLALFILMGGMPCGSLQAQVPGSSNSSEATSSAGMASSLDPSAPASADLLVGLLPEMDASSAPTLKIQSSNAPQFKNLIIPEFFPYVRDGELQLPAYKSLRFDPRDDDDWVKGAGWKDAQLTDDGSIKLPHGAIHRGFAVLPLGQKSMPKGGRTELDALGQGILWNVTSRLWPTALVHGGFTISTFRDQRLERQLDGVFSRMHPAVALGGSAGPEVDGQVFREFVQFTEPQAVHDYRFLTFRFLGTEEDFLWMYSPTLKQVRQLTGSNRSDGLFRSGISLDEFFLWSNKTEFADAHFDRELLTLVSFARSDAAHLEKRVGADPCQRIGVSSEDRETAGLSGVARPVEESIPGVRGQFLLPEGSVFVPRKVQRLELNPRDPFGLTGRVVLYVDKALQLPVAKIVFDRAGQLWKIAFAGLSMASSEDGMRREPFIAYGAVLDVKASVFSLIEHKNLEFCSALPVSIPRDYFDPAHLAPPGQESVPSSSEPRVVKKLEHDEDVTDLHD